MFLVQQLMSDGGQEQTTEVVDKNIKVVIEPSSLKKKSLKICGPTVS